MAYHSLGKGAFSSATTQVSFTTGSLLYHSPLVVYYIIIPHHH